MSGGDGLRRTVLYERHVALGAKMAPFSGWEMPIQYTGIVGEHEACRQRVVIFDTCHMGVLNVSGASAERDLEMLVSCDIGSLVPGRCRYGFLCNDAGGVVDDLVVYRMAPNEFMVVVNAGTQDNDYRWVLAKMSKGTRVEHLAGRMFKVDVQGPGSPDAVASLLAEPVSGLGYYRFMSNTFEGRSVLVSRTGYTGEIGFEVYFRDSSVVDFWDRCINAGVLPAGLGARDTLRLEAGLPLYGHELGETRNASGSGFTRAISTAKDFIGCAALRDHLRISEKLVGLRFGDRRAARNGDAIEDESGAPAGAVTSGSYAPSLGIAIAMGYVRNEFAVVGTRLQVRTQRHVLPATVCAMPFYTEGTVRKKMELIQKRGTGGVVR